MTSSQQPSTPEVRVGRLSEIVARSATLRFISNFPIGRKLLLGFGILVVLTLLVVGLSYVASREATTVINRTGDFRAPMARISANAQANLLRMLAATRGYLALGDRQFIDRYYDAETDFRADLAQLQELSDDLDPLNQLRLQNLEAAFNQWQPLPQQLFALRDDQLLREPAYRTLATDGITYGGRVLIDIQNMIESQALREPSADNIDLLKDMANFQGSFAAMLSGLRNYVTTQNRSFRQEYEVNLVANQFAWQRLLDKNDRGLLAAGQQELMSAINNNRASFLTLPEETIFPILESDRSREDLFLFATQAVPINEQMLGLLDEMTADQQALLQQDLDRGRTGLNRAVRRTLLFGLVAMVLGVAMAVVASELIAGPVRRLTAVAEEIRQGNLDAQAPVESGDEIGILAQTFNRMTSQLRQTLLQVRKEKKRADDLLNVVIPIGVELSSEKNFNRLLENMLVEAQNFCNANAGILYLRRDNELHYTIVRDDAQQISLGGTTDHTVPYAPLPLYDKGNAPARPIAAVQAAVEEQVINIADTRQAGAYDFSGPDPDNDARPTSLLTIPLENSAGDVAGVLQLLDARDPDSGEIVPFDENLQQMMASFSSLATAALEAYIREQALRQEIQQLRIEIDESKRQKQVEEIVDTDFFQDLRAKAREMRRRGRQAGGSTPETSESATGDTD